MRNQKKQSLLRIFAPILCVFSWSARETLEHICEADMYECLGGGRRIEGERRTRSTPTSGQDATTLFLVSRFLVAKLLYESVFYSLTIQGTIFCIIPLQIMFIELSLRYKLSLYVKSVYACYVYSRISLIRYNLNLILVVRNI